MLAGSPTIERCLVYGNTAETEGGGCAFYSAEWSNLVVRDCTIAGNRGGLSSAISHRILFWGIPPGPLSIERTLLALNDGGPAIYCDHESWPVTLTCSDLYGNEGGDWVGPYADQLLIDGNLCADPQFCDLDGGNLSLGDTSPCLPQNNECGVLIGALGEGCTLTAAGPGDVFTVALAPNNPNPFNGTTRILFTLPEAGRVSLTIYDLSGRRVKTLLANESREAGPHGVFWYGVDDAGRPQPSGLYLYRLQAAGRTLTRKMTMIR